MVCTEAGKSKTVQTLIRGVEYWAWSRFGLVKEPEMIRPWASFVRNGGRRAERGLGVEVFDGLGFRGFRGLDRVFGYLIVKIPYKNSRYGSGLPHPPYSYRSVKEP